MPIDSWAPEHVDALKAHVAANILSYKDMARDINERFGSAHSRNAMIGKAKRMGFADGEKGPRPVKEPKPRRANGPLEQKMKRKRQGDHHVVLKISAGGHGSTRVTESTMSAQIAKLRCVEITPRHLSLLDLEPGDCRYPYGGDKDGEAITFCGHPKQDGSSYCTPHLALTRGDSRNVSEEERALRRFRLIRSFQINPRNAEVA
jgi:GcrA cell cycle regulator